VPASSSQAASHPKLLRSKRTLPVVCGFPSTNEWCFVDGPGAS
jgi:hypothetical protein